MDAIARGRAEDRAALFRETAARLGVSPTIAEKDFWVCWTLKRLYTIEGLPRLLFKGGTSLSKCFRIIRRFSEDIDIGIERGCLGLDADEVPADGMGSSRLKKARKRLRERTREYIAEEFLELVRGGFADALGANCGLILSDSETEPTLLFEYPRALGGDAYGTGRYIAPVVRLELGARSDHDPVERVEIVPYAAEQFPQMFEDVACTVVAQARQRTLLEKALILHTDRAKGRVSQRSSRHAYDLAMLHRSGAVELVTPELFRQVATHKRVFGEDAEAGKAVDSGLFMVPTEDLRVELARDYQAMGEMFFEDPLPFGKILADLQELEAAINARR
jgi:hypothetical protein